MFLSVYKKNSSLVMKIFHNFKCHYDVPKVLFKKNIYAFVIIIFILTNKLALPKWILVHSYNSSLNWRVGRLFLSPRVGKIALHVNRGISRSGGGVANCPTRPYFCLDL